MKTLGLIGGTGPEELPQLVRWRDSNERAEHLNPEPIRWGACIFPAASPQHLVAELPGSGGELVGQPAFADSRRPLEQDQAAASPRCLPELIDELGQLAIPACEDGPRRDRQRCHVSHTDQRTYVPFANRVPNAA